MIYEDHWHTAQTPVARDEFTQMDETVLQTTLNGVQYRQTTTFLSSLDT